MTSAIRSTVFIIDDDASMPSLTQRLLKTVGLHTETIEALSNVFQIRRKRIPHSQPIGTRQDRTSSHTLPVSRQGIVSPRQIKKSRARADAVSNTGTQLAHYCQNNSKTALID
jgi:DNA-binding NtrC family response regulator